jgi:hypothetical protein
VGKAVLDNLSELLGERVTAGGGAVYLPAGAYKVTDQLTALNVPIKIFGDGINVTQLRWASD